MKSPIIFAAQCRTVEQMGGNAQPKLQIQIYVSVLAASEYADAGTHTSGNVHVYYCTCVTSNCASAPVCCCEALSRAGAHVHSQS